MTVLHNFTSQSRVAYFSMEIALRPEIPTYSGGLGILAGDTIRSCADLELPVVAVSLVSQRGYFKQEIDGDGHQIEHPDPWNPSDWATQLHAKITVPIEGRQVWVGGWLYTVAGKTQGRQPVILLDTDLYENTEDDRRITHTLYGDGEAYRLKQEIVLGIGGVRMLQALGFRIFHYHMNEGHSSLLALELLRRHAVSTDEVREGESPYNVALVREQCSFTTHTPVEAGHDKFSYDLVARIFRDNFDYAELKKLAGQDRMNMTRLALNLSETINGVTERHAQISRKLFPGYQVRAITNGVHPQTWTCKPMADVFDRYLLGWCHEPELLVRVDCCIPDDEIQQAHRAAKRDLLKLIKSTVGVELNPDLPILGFARRMTAYKRPDLMFSDLERLRAIAAELPFQIVLAGKAHPKDDGGKRLIALLHEHRRTLAEQIPVVYLPNYDMNISGCMVAGVDLWINTPLQPQEASGTSGMKAAFNGVPNFSVLDGWWIEGCIEGVTGWAIGDSGESDSDKDRQSFYDKLQHTVLPLYYRQPEQWLRVMKGAIAKNASVFNSQRMMRRYATEAYIR